ncbi:hypothetical protein [Rubrivivax gelatinosus]|uniref:hypothetical protein n=1 Tax=Rubrivivax gelatinosus TaxID=28068 RepID=UPI0012FD1A9E|nr:hypothetical protein [Rubrivivax gelatinosus]
MVARNRYLGAREAWSEGGTLAEYPLKHWERWQVRAADRVQAAELAVALRAKQQRLPAPQLKLLTQILSELPGATEPDGRSIALEDGDLAVARRLQAKQLIALDEHGNATPLVAAFNFLPEGHRA